MKRVSEMVFQVENIGKAYRIYPSPMHRLKEIIVRRPQHRMFHALSGVTFDVSRGEGFGIVGENGAGKSTLLKILANTLKPTSGTVRRNGRVAALLELGAGFNPDLTGEENIFLNGYLLGLSKGEIQARKQSIIDFSEIEEFMDQPVKNYSSGMVVRLAFSIATSVDPDILIIDEALSVGDLHFQKKCVDRMMAFRKAEKTIVFCSHSMYFINELCSRALWVDHGAMRRMDASEIVTAEYENYSRDKSANMDKAKEEVIPRSTSAEAWIESVEILGLTGIDGGIRPGEELTVALRIGSSRPGLEGHIGVSINRNDELTCFGATTKQDGMVPLSYEDGRTVFFKIPSNPLLSGRFFAYVVLGDETGLHAYDAKRSNPFEVYGTPDGFGILRVNHRWET